MKDLYETIAEAVNEDMINEDGNWVARYQWAINSDGDLEYGRFYMPGDLSDSTSAMDIADGDWDSDELIDAIYQAAIEF